EPERRRGQEIGSKHDVRTQACPSRKAGSRRRPAPRNRGLVVPEAVEGTAAEVTATSRDELSAVRILAGDFGKAMVANLVGRRAHLGAHQVRIGDQVARTDGGGSNDGLSLQRAEKPGTTHHDEERDKSDETPLHGEILL